MKLKPRKGWRYRVIICDDKGRQVNDDVQRADQILPLTWGLIERLKQKNELYPYHKGG